MTKEMGKLVGKEFGYRVRKYLKAGMPKGWLIFSYILKTSIEIISMKDDLTKPEQECFGPPNINLKGRSEGLVKISMTHYGGKNFY